MTDHLSKPIDREELLGALLRARLSPETVPPLAAGETPAIAVAGGGTEAILDTAGALVRLGGNRELYARLLARYQADHATAAEQVVNAMGMGDAERARREAHSLKGVAANLGARRLSALAARIEQTLRQERTVAPELLAQLQATQQDTLRAMRADTAAERPVAVVRPSANLLPKLQQLAQLLHAHDAEAKDYFGSLAPELGSAPTTAFLRLRMAIESYETEAAQDALRDLVREINLGSPVTAEEVEKWP